MKMLSKVIYLFSRGAEPTFRGLNFFLSNCRMKYFAFYVYFDAWSHDSKMQRYFFICQKLKILRGLSFGRRSIVIYVKRLVDYRQKIVKSLIYLNISSVFFSKITNFKILI